MTKPKIAIIIGTTREGRFGDKPAAWLHGIAQQRSDADYEIVDLRDHPLPFFNEPRSPMMVPPADPEALRWARRLAQFDGFVIVAAEYNHGYAAVLKNALDYAYAEFVRKPLAFVAYGNAGGGRAVEQLRLVCVELQMAPIRAAVHLGMTEFVGMLMQGKTFADYPYLDESATKMLDDLSWWTKALKAARAA